jgi:hypothetical protein
VPPEITRENLMAARLSRKKRIWKELRKPKDRFGRQYVVWVDNVNKHPVTSWEPQFTAPVSVPDRFLSIPEDKPWRCEVDFVSYREELREAVREWQRVLAGMMQKFYPDQPDLEPPRKILDLVGPKPQRWELVELANRGDPWCLGLTPERTAAVRFFLKDTETFMPNVLAERQAERGAGTAYLGAEFEQQFGKAVARGAKSRFADEDDADDAAAYRAGLGAGSEDEGSFDLSGDVETGDTFDEYDPTAVPTDLVGDDDFDAADLDDGEERVDLDLTKATAAMAAADRAADVEEQFDRGAVGGRVLPKGERLRGEGKSTRTRPRRGQE